MKKGVIFGIAAAGALLGGVLALCISHAIGNNGIPSRSGFVDRNDRVPTHFTSYDVAGYPDLTYAAENAVKAVVSIDNKGEVRRRSHGGYNPFFEFFGIPQQEYEQPRQQDGDQEPQMRVQGSGSGVLISADGYIVTNNHVVDDASELGVTLSDGRTFTARLVGTDPTTDVALIKIDGEGLPFLPFGDSDILRLGEWVLAIGTPYSLQSTVTAGIVSAKGRNLGALRDRNNAMGLESFIQTDAAVNPGNSGGALVNGKGELVGINTMITSPTGSYAGYSFAVPSSIVRKVVGDLQEYGIVQRAMLGITYDEINNAFLEEFGEQTGITERGGIYVAEIEPGGAAEQAGIRKGDVLTEMNGVPIPDAAALSEQIARYRPNDKVTVRAKRGGEMKQFDVTLRNRTGRTELLSADAYDAARELGGELAEANERYKQQLGIEHGLVVMQVDRQGILYELDIPRNFVITHINGTPIRSLGDLNRIERQITAIAGVHPDGKETRYILRK